MGLVNFMHLKSFVQKTNLFKRTRNFIVCVLAVFAGSLMTSNLCHAEKMADKAKQKEASQMHATTQTAKKVKLLAFSGSIRKDSYNTKALKLLASAANGAGAEVTLINLKDYTLPIYDGDLESEQGLPENARKLQRLIAQHDGFLIASPEYNGLPSPLLKNMLDWTSRPDKSNPSSGLKIFEGKVAGLISASPGAMGGARGTKITAQLLSNLGLKVAPEPTMIGNCQDKFDANGALTDKNISERINKEGRTVARLASAFE